MIAARTRDPDKRREPLASGSSAQYGNSGNRIVAHQPTDSQERRCVATAGKALAVWLYCIDARSLSAPRAAFARHPEWVSA